MKNATTVVLAIVAVVMLGYLVYLEKAILTKNQNETGSQTQTQTQNQAQTNKENCVSEDCLSVSDLEYPVGTLSADATSAIESAIDDEYKAYSTYEAVIEKLGNVRPFAMIIRAEEQHISSLKAIFDKYGVTIPENPYLGKITAPGTLAEACATGSDAEVANAALYRDDLLPKVTDYPDITTVFESLMTASQDKHLPAFNKCK